MTRKNADELNSPKDKIKKGNKSKWLDKALTQEEAVAEGHEYEEFQLNDDFFAQRTNETGNQTTRF